jgi:hypothetical protein
VRFRIAKDTVLAELADWNDWITTEGVCDLVDHYIDRKLNPVLDVIAQGVKGRVKNMPPLASSIQPSRNPPIFPIELRLKIVADCGRLAARTDRRPVSC